MIIEILIATQIFITGQPYCSTSNAVHCFSVIHPLKPLDLILEADGFSLMKADLPR